MSTSLTAFSFESYKIRTVTGDDGEPLFVASDVLQVLTLDRKALERLDDDEKGVSSIHTLGGAQKMTAVTESGLYTLVMGSRKPEAKRFRKWVTSEVLPAIRKTGKYALDTKPASEMLPSEVALATAKAELELCKLFNVPESYATQQIAIIVSQQSGIDHTALLTQAPAMNNVPFEDVMLEPTELGKLYGISAMMMNRKLYELGLQTKTGGSWVPTDKGASMCQRHAWASGHKSGYNLKWRAADIEKVCGMVPVAERDLRIVSDES